MGKWTKACAVLALAVLGFARNAAAQSGDPSLQEIKDQLRQAQEAIQKQQAVIEALQRRLGQLEQAQAAPPVSTPVAHPSEVGSPSNSVALPASITWKDGQTIATFPKAEIRLSNRLQLRWVNDHLSGADRYLDDYSSFSIRRAKTTLTGWAYTKDLTFGLQVDWANANTAKGVLDDAYVNYDFTHGHGYFQLRAGQFKTPFGRQSIASTRTDMFADRSFVTYLFCGIRDVGLMAWGTLGPDKVKDLFEYRVGVFNGGGRSVYTNVDNKYQKNLRLMVSPWGSAGYDEDSPDITPKPKLSLAFEYEENDSRVKDTHGLYKLGSEYHTRGYDLMFRYWRVTAYGEYFDRTQTFYDDSQNGFTGVNAQVGFLAIPRRLELFLGYWGFDPNTAKRVNAQIERGAGVNWYFSGNNSKLQADYRRLHDDVTNKSTYELRCQYQIVF